MSESVKILIEAENKASAVIDKTAKDLDARIQTIKTSGEQAKKSTEFFGTIANALGGSELGAFAGQLAGLTEKTSQFAEVQKLGGAGALAFKAGLAAAVGVIAFQVGSALGNVIFQTEKWTKALAKANEEAKKLANDAAQLQAVRFSENKEDVELIRDPDKKREAYQGLLEDLKKNLIGVEADVRRGKKEVAEWDAAWLKTGNRAAFADQAKEKLDVDKARLEALKGQRLEIEKVLGPRAAENALIKEQNALQDKSEAYLENLRNELEITQAIGAEKQRQVKTKQGGAFGSEAVDEANKLLQAIEAAKEASAKQEKSDAFIAGLREEIELLKAKKDEVFAIEAGRKAFGAEASNEAAQLLAEREALIQKRDAAKQVEEIRQRELDRLEEERILLEKGKEAAHAFNLEKQGLTKADAQRIASEQAAVDKIKQKQSAKQDTPALAAVESRLLTRGSGEDPTKQVAQNTADAVKELQALNKRLADERKYNTTIKVLR